MARVVWYGNVVQQVLRARLASNIGAALAIPLAEMESAIGTQGPPRSAPHHPPHKDTGELFASLFIDVDPVGLGGRIGSDVSHAVYTERGTGKMDPRPWFNTSLLVSINKMARELAK